jgi:hypothetical protein
MRFDLQRIVDKALDGSREPHPHQVARQTLLRIAPEYREEALLVALATYVEARIYERQDDPMPSSTVARADSLRTSDPA